MSDTQYCSSKKLPRSRCDYNIAFTLLPYVYNDKVSIFLDKKGLKKEDLYFFQHPSGDSSSKKILRFFSESWVENNITKATIEKILEIVSQLAVKNHFEVLLTSAVQQMAPTKWCVSSMI